MTLPLASRRPADASANGARPGPRGLRVRLSTALSGALLAAAACGITLATLPAAALAQGTALRFTTNAPLKSPWGGQIERLAATVAAQSGGSVKIEPFYGAQLGNELDTIQQVARGRIDMGSYSLGAATSVVPELQMLMLPFYFDNAAQLDCVLDKHMVGQVDALFAAKGLKLLGINDVGVIDVAGKKSLADVAAVKGLKGTAYSRIQGMLWSAVGANSTFIPVPEWASSLQTGVIDYTTSPVAVYVPTGLNKVAPVYTRLNLWYTPGVILMNKAAYDRLGAEQRAALQRAFEAESAPKLRAEIRAVEEKLRQAHVAAGGQLVDLTPAQRTAWRQVAAGLWPEMVSAVGGQAAGFHRAVETARDSCR